MDNGKFTLGVKHICKGETPSPEEILTLIKSPDDPKIRLTFIRARLVKICLFSSLKTGFGKFVGFDSEAYLIATADAIGARERFDVVFQDVRRKLFL
jgi:hypothetical protein